MTNNNNIIAIFAIILMIFSLTGTAFITFFVDSKPNTLGNAYISQGQVAVTVINCGNSLQDGDEEGVDCGGSCPSSCSPGVSSGGGGGGGGTSKKESFTTNPSSITLFGNPGEKISSQLQIINDGETKLEFDFSFNELKNILSISEPNFFLSNSKTKDLTINADIPTDFPPGVYLSELAVKTNKITKKIPIILEIESPKTPFDIKVTIPQEFKILRPGESFTPTITIFNLLNTQKEVQLFLEIKDFKNKLVYASNETIITKETSSLLKKITLSNDVKEGNYALIAKISYQDSIAVSSDVFTVDSQKISIIQEPTQPNQLLTYLIAILVILLLIGVSITLYLQHRKISKINKIQVYKSKKKASKISQKKNQQISEKNTKINLQKQRLLESYKQNYISKESYEKGLKKLNKIRNR